MELQSLQDAIQLLHDVSVNNRLAMGSTEVWRKMDHAKKHLDKQIALLLAEV